MPINNFYKFLLLHHYYEIKLLSILPGANKNQGHSINKAIYSN